LIGSDRSEQIGSIGSIEENRRDWNRIEYGRL
jgi:hypothetical protein